MAIRVRRVTGKVLRSNGAAWAGGVVKFNLEISSYTLEAHFPADKVEATLSANGEILGTTGAPGEQAGVPLWCDQDGLVPTRYLCTLPDGSFFRFDLAYGDGSNINLSTLRAAGSSSITPTDPLYATVEALIAEALDELGGGSFANQAANQVFAGPSSGGAAAPVFRALVAADIPTLAQSKITNLASDLATLAAAITGKQPFSQNLADIAALTDPNADRLLFWDDSAGGYRHLTLGANLSITGTTIDAAGGGGSLNPIFETVRVTPLSAAANNFRLDHSDGSPRVQLGTYPSVSSYAALWLGDITPSGNNYAFISNGTSETIFNGPLSGALLFRIGQSTTALELTSSVANFFVDVRRNGTKILGTQGAAVANATDNASAIERLNDLLSRLRGHGLIAT